MCGKDTIKVGSVLPTPQRESAGYLAVVLVARCQYKEVIYFCDL